MTYIAAPAALLRTDPATAIGNAGFAYILLLITVAVIGISSAAAVLAGARMSRRSAEEQLLYVGGEFERALIAYRFAGTSGPKALADLLRDARVPAVKRHLRRIPFDPLTGTYDWGVERDALGNIVAVFSLASGTPLKKSGFDAMHSHFAPAQSYQDWRFGVITSGQAGAREHVPQP